MLLDSRTRCTDVQTLPHFPSLDSRGFCRGCFVFTYWVDSGNHPGSNDSMKIWLITQRNEMVRGRTVTPAGVTFEPGVLEYLELLRERDYLSTQ